MRHACNVSPYGLDKIVYAVVYPEVIGFARGLQGILTLSYVVLHDWHTETIIPSKAAQSMRANDAKLVTPDP